ncbi:hypothetical protein ACNKHK_27290 [Shigella flexneri]
MMRVLSPRWWLKRRLPLKKELLMSLVASVYPVKFGSGVYLVHHYPPDAPSRQLR